MPRLMLDRFFALIRFFAAVLAAVLWLTISSATRAGDWPQILGPARNGVADQERIAETFPAGRPKTVWEREVGEGLAGVAVAQGVVVLFHRVGDEEIVEAMDALTGKPVWKTGFPTQYAGGIAEDNGPRCVPLVHKDRVFVFGAGGSVHCVAGKTGEKLWSRAAYKEFGGSEGYFGAGSTPIVEGDKLIVNVGGKGAGLVAFSIANGKTLWQGTDEGASYSSPMAVTIDGVRHVIFVTRLNAVSVNPDNGEVRFRIPFGARGPTVNGASPLVFDGQLFLSASYGIGATLAKIGKNSASVAWANDEVMSSQYTTGVYVDGSLYGIDGRQDQGVARLRCIEPKEGEVRWTKEGFGMATLILADGKLVILKTDGTLVLAAASPKAYRELASAKVFDNTTRPLPALSNGRLYARDTRVLKCIDLRK